MNEFLNLFVPHKKLKVCQWDYPWLSLALCHLDDYAHHRALRSGSAGDWSSYVYNYATIDQLKPCFLCFCFVTLGQSRHILEDLSVFRSKFPNYNLLLVTADEFNIIFCQFLLRPLQGSRNQGAREEKVPNFSIREPCPCNLNHGTH